MNLTCPHCSGLIQATLSVEKRRPLKAPESVELWDEYGRVHRGAKLAVAHLINYMGGGEHSSAHIQHTYQTWGSARGMPPLGRRNLGRILRMHGCTPYRSSTERGWVFPETDNERPSWYDEPGLGDLPKFDTPVGPSIPSGIMDATTTPGGQA